MNNVYRLIWNINQQVWIAVSELGRTKKKTKTIGAIILIGFGLSNTQVIAANREYTLEIGVPYNALNTANVNAQNGADEYKFFTQPSTTAAQNIVNINKDIYVSGAYGRGPYSPDSSVPDYYAYGGYAIQGNNITFNNEGDISGGNGYAAEYSYGRAAISGDNLIINNNNHITGGYGSGGRAYAEPNQSGNGYGSAAIIGNNLLINNSNNANIIGGFGSGYGDDGYGIGGSGISGNIITINNEGGITGGDGSYSKAGDGVSGNSITINNEGSITGGSGSYGKAGDGVSGNSITINNEGSVTGGYSSYGVSGNGIIGGNLTIKNSGSIINSSGNSILFTKGDNRLTLETGSIIRGDVVLDSAQTNTLSITNNSIEETTINGNLIANDATHVSLSGQNIKFTGDATFKANTNLSFDSNCLSVSCVGQKLTVNNWIREGTDGHITFNTVFGDDDSPTDKLVILGEASGTTEVKFNKIGGNGAQTINGIQVIQTGSSESNKTFYLANRAISAGAYDYGLFRQKQVLIGTEFENVNDDGNTPDTYDNWYLKSHLRDNPTYTPDVGEYLAVETMGNTLFTSRLEDREGASQYQNLGDNDTGNVWVRAYGGHHQFKSMQDQLKTKGNSFVTQIGAGLVTLGEEDQYNLGAMGGFATYDGKTRSNVTDRESKTKINGYSLGLYGTWYAHPVEKRGAYIDSWVLWNKFNNKIDTPDQNQYKYDSSGVTASIEVGGDYLLNKNGKKDWWIQPQVQLIYQGVHADNFQDAQGVDINHGQDNLQARMGVKTYLNIPTDSSKSTSYRPYVALNFIHNTNPYSVEINDIRYENEGSANLGELKLGVEGQVTKNSQVWLNASYVAGSHSNQAYQGNIGWKYNF